MKIAIDIRALMGHRISGIGNYIFFAVKNILELDQENEYFLLTSGWKKFDLPAEFKKKNVQHIHVKLPNKLFNLKLLLKIGRPLDHYFPEAVDLFWLPNLIFYKFSDEAKVIFTVHDLSFLHTQSFYSLKMKIWHLVIRISRIVYRSHRIIAVSKNTKRDIMRMLTVPSEKIRTIYPGINRVTMDEHTARKIIAPFNIADKYFMFLGNIEPRKNILSIIKAFDLYHQDYPDYELVLVGGLGWIYQKTLKEIKKRPYIKYLGYVNSPEKDALYYLCQALIWPSFYEGFGFPPLEATAYQRPTIVSYKTSLPEIMNQQSLYVDPYNFREIYEMMTILTKNKILRQRLIESAKKYPVPDWQTQAKEIINLFKECA